MSYLTAEGYMIFWTVNMHMMCRSLPFPASSCCSHSDQSTISQQSIPAATANIKRSLQMHTKYIFLHGPLVCPSASIWQVSNDHFLQQLC